MPRRGATRGAQPSSARRALVAEAPGSGRVTRTPGRSGKDVGRRVRAQAPAELRADAGGLGGRTGKASLEEEGAVLAGDEADEEKTSSWQEPGMAADRRAAGTVECCEQGALGGSDRGGLAILDGGEKLKKLGIVGANRDADDALAGRRDHGLDIERQHVRTSGDIEPAQPREGQNPGRKPARANPGEAGADIAAQRHDREIGPRGQKLRLAPHGGRADPPTRRKGRQGSCGSGTPLP